MESHTPEQLPIRGMFGRRKVRPCVCIVNRKLHIRTFLRSALEELEFTTCECAKSDRLAGMLHEQQPDLVVLGLSASGGEGEEALNTLAAEQFLGKVLLLGPIADHWTFLADQGERLDQLHR